MNDEDVSKLVRETTEILREMNEAGREHLAEMIEYYQRLGTDFLNRAAHLREVLKNGD